MVGSDVDDDGYEWALPVGLGDDPVGEQAAGSLVLPNCRVPTEIESQMNTYEMSIQGDIGLIDLKWHYLWR